MIAVPRLAEVRVSPFVAVLLCSIVITCPAAPALADGLYGRFDGDVMIAGGVGTGAGFAEGDVTWLATAEVRARYLDSVGPFALLEGWGDGGARVLVGVEVRPLFPSVFLLNASSGDEWLDLAVQSVGLELGVALGPFGTEGSAGAAWVFGAAFELPIIVPSMFGQGMFLRVAARHVAIGSQDLAAPSGGASDWTLTASWVVRGSVGLGFASREVPRYRPD